MNPATARLIDLAAKPRSELDGLMRRGQTPDLDNLVGREFRGLNTAAWSRRLRMQRFIKGFERQADGRVIGYNRRVDQSANDPGWTSPSERFAFFEARPVDPTARDNHYLQALLLDYSVDGSRRDVARIIRDYLVRVDNGSDDLLLGRAFVTIGRWRPSPTFFAIARHS